MDWYLRRLFWRQDSPYSSRCLRLFSYPALPRGRRFRQTNVSLRSMGPSSLRRRQIPLKRTSEKHLTAVPPLRLPKHTTTPPPLGSRSPKLTEPRIREKLSR